MPHDALPIWVLDEQIDDATFERLGDARAIADRMDSRVAALIVGAEPEGVDRLIHHGADYVCCARVPTKAAGARTCVTAAQRVLAPHRPRLILASGQPRGREWAALLAVAGGYKLISPALMVALRGQTLEVTALRANDGMARLVHLSPEDAAIVTLRPGVGEMRPADPARQGEIVRIVIEPQPEAVEVERVVPADPASVDIRFANRLVAGGRGLGGKEGFDLLRSFAHKLDAGVAASRMAVDLGWIEQERQVGQTGKTVSPDLYIACGISGASHHLEGMTAARHIVAINSDPEAPIFKVAHLGLVADLFEILRHVQEELSR